MSNPDPTFIPTPVSGAVVAVLTIAQAVPAIDKRLGRVSEVESQIGPLPALVRRVYVRVQQLYRAALILVTLVGIAMVLTFLFPAAFSDPRFEVLRENGVLLVASWLVLGAVMYTNTVSRCLRRSLLWLSYLVPFRRKLGIERLDHHAAWQALDAFVGLNENAKPLIVSEGGAVTFVDHLLRALQTGAPVSNRAVAPSRPNAMDADAFRRRLGNGLLVGCVIEEMHYGRGSTFPRRDWGPFYDVIGELVINTALFDVETVRQRHDSYTYYDELMSELSQRSIAHGQPAIPESPELIERLKGTLTVVTKEYRADVTTIDPGSDRTRSSRLEIIYERIGSLPALESDSMQSQFVKLCVVWNIWLEMPLDDFRFPFSVQIAALLLDRGVILATEDVKALAFDRQADRELQRAAMRMITDYAASLIEKRREPHVTWLPAASRSKSGADLRWWITYELDFRIWDYARRLHSGPPPSGDGLTRWKYQYGQVARVKP